MKKSYVAIVLSGFFSITFVISSFAAQPKSKPWWFGWLDYNYNEAAIMPNKSGSKHYHPDQWRQELQKIPYDKREKIINKAINDGFIGSLLATDEVATVYTGPLYKELSYPDKQNLMRIVATHYAILDTEYGMFTIRDEKTKQYLGTYTRYGLQIE